MCKKYKNPMYGHPHLFGGNYPQLMTKEELITLCSENCIGGCNSIESMFDSFLGFLESETKEQIDFRFWDLSIEELGIVDDIVFTCEDCGWNYCVGEKHADYEDGICVSCANIRDDEENGDF